MLSWSVSSDHEEGEQPEADPDEDLNALRVEVLDRDPDDVDPFGITKPERGWEACRSLREGTGT